jgi:hypothetical protein
MKPGKELKGGFIEAIQRMSKGEVLVYLRASNVCEAKIVNTDIYTLGHGDATWQPSSSDYIAELAQYGFVTWFESKREPYLDEITGQREQLNSCTSETLRRMLAHAAAKMLNALPEGAHYRITFEEVES